MIVVSLIVRITFTETSERHANTSGSWIRYRDRHSTSVRVSKSLKETKRSQDRAQANAEPHHPDTWSISAQPQSVSRVLSDSASSSILADARNGP